MADSLLGPVPGFVLLGGILSGALFYYLHDPKNHPTLGEKIVKGDERFDQYKDDGYLVHAASNRVVDDDDDAPSTRNLYLYFKAKGYEPTNKASDEYEYIALPPTRTDWVIEFFLWWLIPLIAALVHIGARIVKVAGVVAFLYVVLALVYVIGYMPFSYLFGGTVGVIFSVIALGIVVVLIATRYRNTRVVQWVF